MLSFMIWFARGMWRALSTPIEPAKPVKAEITVSMSDEGGSEMLKIEIKAVNGKLTIKSAIQESGNYITHTEKVSDEEAVISFQKKTSLPNQL